MASDKRCDSLMRRLASLGDARFRQTIARQGETREAFGVPYATLYKLEKELGPDQALADNLWQTGTHDARILAGLIADPAKMKATTLDKWAKSIDNEFMLHAVAGAAARTDHARSRAESWIETKSEWMAAAGWHLIGVLASKPDGPFEEAEVMTLLLRIEGEIGTERNRVKHSMNSALIGMSAWGPAVGKRCSAVAKKIGKVDVDHGETSCKTPDAGPYIEKMRARVAARQATARKNAAKKKAAEGAKKVPARKVPAKKKQAPAG